MKKNALVTGGNTGIGYATAALLRDRGYDVTISGRDRERVERAASELGANGLVADMGRIENVWKLGVHFRETGLDVLVNAAAIAELVPVGRYAADAFDRHIHINLRGPLFLIQELLPALELRRGAVTSVASLIVTDGAPGMAFYAATKGAIEAMTRGLAKELAPRGVRINVVAPGAIERPMFGKLGLDATQQEALAVQQRTAIPLQRRGEPNEVAQVIVAQLESSYVTGSVWHVDGGIGA